MSTKTFIEHSCIQSFILINAIYPITKTLCMTLEVTILLGYGRYGMLILDGQNWFLRYLQTVTLNL
jgi:hypothetical protein